MMGTDLIKEREKRYEKRKKAKQEFDKLINLGITQNCENKTFKKLSANSDGKTVRLLDEGVVVDAYGYSLFYIPRGELSAFYDRLPDDYEGSVNIGHQEFASFPFLVGQWSKKDLSLVDIGEGRKGLDVKLNLDDESIFIKELKRKDYSVGVSAEFSYEIDFDKSMTLELEVVRNINIMDFAIVGEAGNVNSGDINLKTEGDVQMEKQSFLEKLLTKYNLSSDSKKNKELKEEQPKEDQKTDELKKDQQNIDGVTEDELQGFADKFEEVIEENEQLLKVVGAADKENEALKSKLAEKEKELAAYEKNVPDALGRFKELAAHYGVKQKELKESKENKEKINTEKSEDGWGAI